MYLFDDVETDVLVENDDDKWSMKEWDTSWDPVFM